MWGGCGACRWAMGGWWLTPHTPTMAISSMHGWGWGWAAVISAVGVCGCVRVVQRRAVGWGAAAQAYLSPAAPSSAGSAHPHSRATTKNLPLQTPQSAAPFGSGGDHVPTRCRWRRSTYLCLQRRQFLRPSVFWRPVRPGSAHRQPDWLPRPDFFCVGMGGMGEGGRVRKMGRGGHGRG